MSWVPPPTSTARVGLASLLRLFAEDMNLPFRTKRHGDREKGRRGDVEWALSTNRDLQSLIQCLQAAEGHGILRASAKSVIPQSADGPPAAENPEKNNTLLDTGSRQPQAGSSGMMFRAVSHFLRVTRSPRHRVYYA